MKKARAKKVSSQQPLAFLNGKVELHHGDCLDVLKALPENSIDSGVMDPPYHLHSIVKRFAKAGRTDSTRTKSGPHQRTATGFMNKQWDGGDIAFDPATWEAVYRVLKPGAYLLAFSSCRTFGRMQVAIEDAGFITHPFIAWIFGQGFPKAHRVQDDAWHGWRYGGQALKPAIEPIYMGQKPFSEKNGTLNVQRWGTGALNIDGCRVPGAKPDTTRGASSKASSMVGTLGAHGRIEDDGLGRWPANVITDGSDEVFSAFPEASGQQRAVGPEFKPKNGTAVYGDYGPRPHIEPRDEGGSAARFFYTAKADDVDRAGSKHPTVKPVDLIQYLVRLVTPKGGTVLDCFAGTGTTGEAAFREGMKVILIEREVEYIADIKRRMALVLAGPEERARESLKARGLANDDAGPLFGGASESRGGGAGRFTANLPTRAVDEGPHDWPDGIEAMKP